MGKLFDSLLENSPTYPKKGGFTYSIKSIKKEASMVPRWYPGKGRSAQEVVSIYDEPMPFGKHEGTKLQDLPANYVEWLLEQEWFQDEYPDYYEYLEENYV